MHRQAIAIISLAAWAQVPLQTAAAEADTVTTVIEFNIRPQPLTSALLSFAQLAETELFLLPEERFTGWRSSAVAGSMTPDEALDRLLSCTPFEGDVSEDRVVVLRRRDGASMALGAAEPTPPRNAAYCPPDGGERPRLVADQLVKQERQALVLDEPRVLAGASGARLRARPA